MKIKLFLTRKFVFKKEDQSFLFLNMCTIKGNGKMGGGGDSH